MINLRTSIAAKWLSGQIVGFLLTVSLAIGILYASDRQIIYAQVESTGINELQTLAEIITNDPHLINDPGMSAVLARLVAKFKDIQHISLVDYTLHITADSNAADLGKVTTQTALIKVISEARTDRFFYTQDGRNYLRLSQPILGAYDLVRQSNVVGAISLDIGLTNAEQRIQRAFGEMILLVIGSLIVFLIVQYTLIRRLLLNPLQRIARATQRFGQGEYKARVPAGSPDEIGQLGQSFNHMADAVQRARESLQVIADEHQRAEETVQKAHIQLAGQVNEMNLRAHELALLSEMGEQLQISLTTAEAYTAIAYFIRQLFPVCRGGIYITSNSRNLVEAVTVWGNPPPAQSVFVPSDCWALRRGQVYRIEDSAQGLLCAHAAQTQTSEAPKDGETSQVYSTLCVPMMAQGETMGILHLQSDQPQNADNIRQMETKQNLAVTVAEHLALALANLNLRETLRQQSIRDALTGLFNRRYLDETLQRETLRAQRSGATIGVIMLDIDHFKKFNDTYGHEAGDVVLQRVGKLLQSHVRGEDIACRYGGEEFTLILPGAALEIARERAEHVRQEAATLRVQFGGQSLPPITFSLGVALFPAHGESSEAVLQAADAALYHAKQNGRNRVEAAKKESETQP